MDYICRYKMSTTKLAPSRSLRVQVCVAMVPGKTAPTHKVGAGRPAGGIAYYVYPDGFFDKVKAACVIAKGRAKEVAESLGLPLAEAVEDPSFETWAKRPAVGIDYINFLWLSVDVPYGKGQKKLAREAAKEFAKLSEEFRYIMDVQLLEGVS